MNINNDFLYLKSIRQHTRAGEAPERLRVFAAVTENQFQIPHNCSKPFITPVPGEAETSELLGHQTYTWYTSMQLKHSYAKN